MQKIEFEHKNRFVSAELIRMDEKTIVVKLIDPYQGKNDYWEPGEEKVFYRNNCKKIRITGGI
ncbi:hypothetical protein ACTJJB_01710 [Chitinophaga sp. 22536]|uniref:hypothetical protein n=1 Tax=unclassified Chitinophaga TaxID=2619133 RepID=UPI003F87F748